MIRLCKAKLIRSIPLGSGGEEAGNAGNGGGFTG
jgi:hypothetical protein